MRLFSRTGLYGGFVTVQAADLVTSAACLSLGHPENNPLVAAIFSEAGLFGFALVKLAALVAVGALALKLPSWVIDPAVMLAGSLTGLAALSNALLAAGWLA